MKISEFQKVIEDTYGEKDRKRGVESTFLWFSEEVGELARAINGRTTRENLRHEFADVLAWLTTLASIANIDLQEVAEERYGKGCPRCKAIPCMCDEIKQRAYRCG
ncbi:MAG: nucleotide pyrophosphohydrolase [Planctomycetes bacterium]|nr:nucleotide pyrophosphohydrolase [Planctomycetota bacterium]